MWYNVYMIKEAATIIKIVTIILAWCQPAKPVMVVNQHTYSQHWSSNA
jgi:hypothetical protein